MTSGGLVESSFMDMSALDWRLVIEHARQRLRE